MHRPDMWLSGPVLDAADPIALADFYAQLLGWVIEEREGPRPGEPPESGWAKLRAPDGKKLEIQWEPNYVAPTWPPVAGEQLMMMHLDIATDDLERATVWATAAGATVAPHQPQADVRVMLDPEGHPFCLFEVAPDDENTAGEA